MHGEDNFYKNNFYKNGRKAEGPPTQPAIHHPNERVIANFRRTIYRFFREQGRILPWRETQDPYRILVSEIMLQQTQVDRVLKKYEPFIAAFPDFPTLAHAPLQRILQAWQGLGYNRRCIALKRCSELVLSRYGGILPDTIDELVKLPGIGSATASALLTFTYNIPTTFVETNIRMVYIHFFFPETHNISDRDIHLLVEKTLDQNNPREWYYALMDYGSMLKKKLGNLNQRSKQYSKQPPFQGSNRQIRGIVLSTILSLPLAPAGHHGSRGAIITEEQLLTNRVILQSAGGDRQRIAGIIRQLEREGFIKKTGGGYRIGD